MNLNDPSWYNIPKYSTVISEFYITYSFIKSKEKISIQTWLTPKERKSTASNLARSLDLRENQQRKSKPSHSQQSHNWRKNGPWRWISWGSSSSSSRSTSSGCGCGTCISTWCSSCWCCGWCFSNCYSNLHATSTMANNTTNEVASPSSF